MRIIHAKWRVPSPLPKKTDATFPFKWRPTNGLHFAGLKGFMECKQSSRNGSSLSYDTCDGRAGCVVEKWKRHLSLSQAVDPLVPCRFVEGFWRDRNLETFWKMTFVQKFNLPFFWGGWFSHKSLAKSFGVWGWTMLFYLNNWRK